LGIPKIKDKLKANLVIKSSSRVVNEQDKQSIVFVAYEQVHWLGQ